MSDAPHTRTGYTTVDPSEGEQAKPCCPDPVMDAVRRCAEIASPNFGRGIITEYERGRRDAEHDILRGFGLLPTSET